MWEIQSKFYATKIRAQLLLEALRFMERKAFDEA